MRITAGSLRGRRLQAPDLPGLRPTPAKVREALFNILHDIDGFRVLDLFAGSGIMALEALSRGAADVVSVDQSRKATRHMQQIRDDWQLAGPWRIMPGSVEKELRALKDEKFGLIFADPPYEKGYLERIPDWLNNQHIQCSTLVIEESARVRPDWPQGWHCRQSRRYGDSCLHFLEQVRQEQLTSITPIL